MKIRSVLTTGLTALLLITAIAAGAAAPVRDSTLENNINESRAKVLIHRLHEINDMKKEGLNRGEKKQLRKEVVQIKKEMQTLGKGVYLSVGAIIIIILLLILIL
ncbi:MAG TPA: hypothetical protein VFV46_04620 [Lacibacter sp.]|nr:hypothetical protein [Lacibacter sp.]